MGAPRIQQPGTIHATISDALDAARRRRIIQERGYDAPTLSHWCDPAEANGRRMTAAQLDELSRPVSDAPESREAARAFATVVARHFAALAACELRELGAGSATLSLIIAMLTRGSADIAALTLSATDPEGPGGATITPREMRELILALDELGSAVAAARVRLTRDEARPGLRAAE